MTTSIRIRNTSKKPTLVPARGGFSLVLGPGEDAAVCPEGVRSQSTFWEMMASGVISGMPGQRLLPHTYFGGDGGNDRAA